MNDTDTRAKAAADSVGQSPLDSLIAGRENRIDPPHRLANGRDDDVPVPAVEGAAEEDVEIASLAMVQQLRLQAQQLSEHLGRQQANLDRREAELQSRAAHVEQQERTGRLWLKDRHEELAERERALATRENELRELDRREAAAGAAEAGARERMREIEAAAAALKDAASAHDQLLEDLERRSTDLDTRRDATLELIRRFLSGELQRSAASRTADNPCLELDELADLLGQLQKRRQNIAEVESLLRLAESEVAQLRQALLSERKQFETQRQSDLRRHQESRQLAEADLNRRRQALELASQQVELRRAAVDQLQAELTAVQRETLETRLAAEELLAELAGAVPPAQLSRRIAQSRAKLADYYRVEQHDLAEQRRQLEALAVEISQQHDGLANQKRELDAWLHQRRTEADATAARLAQREEQIEQECAKLERHRFDWHRQRQEYQQEIARLLAELGR